MAGKDIIMISQRELKRLHVIHKVLDVVLEQAEAAEILSLSDRQIRRIVNRIRIEGDYGIRHKARGQTSNRRLPKRVKDKVIQLYRQKYKDFGPTFASVHEIDGTKVNDETLRTWLIESGDWKKARKGRVHRRWRERKNYFGEMIQLDGSHHDWFEGRGPKCVFMGYIDDATGKVFGRFYAYEGTIPAMDSFKWYIRKYGIPMSVYMDKHTTYKSTAKLSIEDEINNTEPLSEFGRSLKELGVELIHANSPQAKGRVERLFKTLQDRLVKEMRLRGIKTIEEANKFLDKYLPLYNKKFAVKPKGKENLHRDIPKGLNLHNVLCIKTERALRNDFTIAHNKRLYQIEDKVKAEKVIVEERINGSMVITHNGTCLKFKEITTRPEKQQKQPRLLRKKTSYKPPVDHPWRKLKISANGNKQERNKWTWVAA